MVERSGDTSSVHRSGDAMETKLLRIAEKARKDKKVKFTSLFHLMNKEHLRGCFQKLRKNASAGIDGETKEDYTENLEENLETLVERLHRMSYIPQAVRRVEIDKPGSKKKRPLGIPVLEDKIVQSGMTRIIECIYEQDFIEDSYGFRPGRNQHDALRALSITVEDQYVDYIVDADIKGFFDNIDHEWMMKFLGHRIADSRILRMVKRFLKADIMINGKLHKSEKGAPQGGVISPILANVYLHYVLDLWFEKRFKKQCKGYTRLIRYCDDFVVCFQNKYEADRFLRDLKERLGKFGLEIEPTKTKIIEFGRFAEQNAAKRGKRPETFDFLGFTHYCSRSRNGRMFRMKRVTSRKRFTLRLKEFKMWIKASRNLKKWEIMEGVKRKLLGHYNYYGITDNFTAIQRYQREVYKILFRWLNRRGKRNCLTWDKFNLTLKHYRLPNPRIMVKLY